VRESIRIPLLIVAILLAISAPLYFVRGIGIFDDSLYLKEGQLILDGFKPYRDFYDNKPPALYYVSAAIAAVGGRGWLAPRIFLFLFAAGFQLGLVGCPAPRGHDFAVSSHSCRKRLSSDV